MSQSKAKLLRCLIDYDGSLDTDFARRVFVHGSLTPEHFYDYDYKTDTSRPTPAALVFEFVQSYYLTYNSPPSIDAITAELMSRTELDAFKRDNVHQFLLEAQQFEPSWNDFDFMLDQAIEDHMSHKAMSVLQRGLKTIPNDPVGGINFIQKGMAEALSMVRVSEDSMDSTLTGAGMAQFLLEELDKTGEIMHSTVQYPYHDANRLLGGMAPGELIVFAGPSNVGKSFILHDIAYHTAIQNGQATVCADREMLHPQNGLRFVSRQTQVPSRLLRSKNMRNELEEEILRAFLEEFADQTANEDRLLFIPPMRCVNTDMIKQEVDKAWGDRAPKLIVADYLTEFEPTRRTEGWENVKRITHDLKQLALFYACPCVTAAQINAKGEVQYKTIRHVCDTLIILSESPDQPYIPPGPNELVGIPGRIVCDVDKARNEAKAVTFFLEVEFATASVKQPKAFGRSAIGRAAIAARQDQDGHD